MNQTILISGASSGLGLAIAEALHKEGAQVYGTSRNPDKYNFSFDLIKMDLEDPASIKTAVDEVVTQTGRIDVLINNAGIGMAGPVEQMQENNMDKLLQTNTVGPILLMQAVLPHMRTVKGGKIVNISSLGAALGLPYRSLYCASKAALDIISDSLRMEMRSFGIQSTSIWCGDLITPIGDRRIKDINLDDPTYKESFTRVYEAIDADVEGGMEVGDASSQIINILKKKQLKRRYMVAKPFQKLSVWAKRILPDQTFDQIINYYSKV